MRPQPQQHGALSVRRTTVCPEAQPPHALAHMRRRSLSNAAQLATSVRGLLGDWAPLQQRVQSPPNQQHRQRQGTSAAAGTAAELVCLQQQQQQQQQLQPVKMERKPLAPPGYSRTFYKRQLPSPPAIEFASDRGKAGGGRHPAVHL